MKQYIGTKVVLAVPMTRAEYDDYRGWQLPADEDGTDVGYLVEYTDKPNQQNHPDHAGYISWSPKEVFEGAYNDTSKGMTFGHAIEALKRGAKVAAKVGMAKVCGYCMCLVTLAFVRWLVHRTVTQALLKT